MNVNDRKVLVLNANWQAISTCTIREAFEDICKETFVAINFETFTPVLWNDWIKLDAGESHIRTSQQAIRIPAVIIARNYNRVATRMLALNHRNVRKVHKNRCAYSGKILKEDQSSLEHVIPSSKGGETVWGNIVLADKRINSLRGNMSLEDFERKHGYKLRVKPIVPKPALFCKEQHLDAEHLGCEEWRHFLC